MRPDLTVLLCSLVIATLPGCSGRPSVPAPKFNANAIASEAMRLFDADQDGFLTKDELSAAPGLRDGLNTIDKDGDEKMTGDEIKARIEALIKSKNASQIVDCQVTRNGKPVTNAVIKFEPEPFLSDFIVGAEATTDMAGKAELNCGVTPYGMQPGFYRVSITTADGAIPEEYNTATTLGAEVSGLSKGNQIGCYFFELP